MKRILILNLCFFITSFATLAQELDPATVSLEPLTSVEALKKRGISEEEINKAISASKSDLKSMVSEQEFKKYHLIGVDIDEGKISMMPKVPFRCEEELLKDKELTTTSKNTDDILKALQSEKGHGNGGMIYITWGYNRTWFNDADTTFKTPNGTFTFHNAHATDRPSTKLKTYFTDLTIPQYNVRIGYKFNKKWSVEVGTDHMKWVMDPNTKYEISGNYDKPVWIHDGNWANFRQVSFEQAKAEGNGSFVMMEHSDGYNYPHATAFFTSTLLKSPNERFRLDGSVGAGFGMLVPKTRMRIADTPDGTFRDVDNKFHIAGWGAHVETNAKFVYATKKGDEYFLQASNRGHMGKINNALYLGSEGSISQAPIYTYEVYVSVGYAKTLGNGKKKK